jgi:NADPH:quinone reductase
VPPSDERLHHAFCRLSWAAHQRLTGLLRQNLGADLVVDHAGDVTAQLATAGIPAVDLVLSTANSHGNLPWIANLLRPFGHLSVVDGSPGLDVNLLVPKSVSLHTEMIFSRLLNDYAPETHGAILDQVAAFVAEGQIRPIVTTRWTVSRPRR